MGRLEKKYEHLSKAIASFKQAFSQHHKWQTEIEASKIEALGIDYDGIVLNLRDSMIQRFEYSTDLLWKYLKSYLHEKHSIVPETISPSTIVRESARVGFISEQEAKTILEMIKKRNLTSHIYQEEIAEMLSAELPNYLATMQKIVTTLNV